MRLNRASHVISVLTLLAAALPASAATPLIEAKSEAAVIAADDAWEKAEVAGDAAFLEDLLLPGYQSIGADGRITTRDQLVDSARKRGASPTMAAEVDAWKATHPIRARVVVFGDTAVLTWTLTVPGTADPAASCDVFLYREGRWHAVYSQHSSAAA